MNDVAGRSNTWCEVSPPLKSKVLRAQGHVNVLHFNPLCVFIMLYFMLYMLYFTTRGNLSHMHLAYVRLFFAFL